MKAIVGLGNVGEKYTLTRHNVGFAVVDALARLLDIHFSRISKLDSLIARNGMFVLAKPTTMMNSSGVAVEKVLNFYKIRLEDLYVVHDDLDIRIGEYKIQLARGPKVHNGLNSIEKSVGSSDFWKIRVGVDNRDPEDRAPGKKYVLDNFTLEEKIIMDTTTEKVCKNLATL